MADIRYVIKGHCIQCDKRIMNWIVKEIPKDLIKKCPDCETTLTIEKEEIEI